MIEQAKDFYAESEALYALLEPLSETDSTQPTQFKRWTANDIIAHLHWGNYAADLALRDGTVFAEFARQMMAARREGRASADRQTRLLATRPSSMCHAISTVHSTASCKQKLDMMVLNVPYVPL